jgi:hypothetical protein
MRSDRKNVTIQGTDGNGTARSVVVRHTTATRARAAQEAGATIIINCNKEFAGRGFGTVEKLAHTTPKKRGDPHHIIWSCYPKPEEL